VSEETIWKWYLNLPEELRLSFLSPEDKKYVASYYREVGLLKVWRKSFFHHHFSRTFFQATQFLLEGDPRPRILDLGCGTGTQSLLFALTGADVFGLDLDEKALAILEKRKAFYEKESGRSLSLQVFKANSLEFDYRRIAPINGVYSMFAFNLMQPSSELINRLLVHLAPHARIAILDGNNLSWMARLLPWRKRAVWSPPQLRNEFAQRGLRVVAHEGGVVLPPLFWPFLPYPSGAALDRTLARGWLFPISHQILAEKK
jgi:SAM-dependent methyltransferase